MIGAREAKILFLLVLFAVGGCGKGNEPGKAPGERAGEIVRVGDAVLTGDDLNRLVPEDEQIPLTFEERREFVRRWVDTEVLRQEAIRRGLKTDPYVEARLRELEQQFLADYLVFAELRKRTEVSEEEIEAYYAAHEREYLNEYRVSQILVGTPEDAERVIELLKTKSWAWVANRYSIDRGREARRRSRLPHEGEHDPRARGDRFRHEAGRRHRRHQIGFRLPYLQARRRAPARRARAPGRQGARAPGRQGARAPGRRKTIASSSGIMFPFVMAEIAAALRAAQPRSSSPSEAQLFVLRSSITRSGLFRGAHENLAHAVLVHVLGISCAA